MKGFNKPEKVGNNFTHGALGVPITTLRRHLKQLTEDDFICVYFVASGLNGSNDELKLYEINFKKVVAHNKSDAKTRELLEQIDKNVVQEMVEKCHLPPTILVPPLPFWQGSPIYNTYIDNIYMYSNTLAKANNPLSAVSDTPRTIENFSVCKKVEEVDILKSISIPKKVRVLSTRPDSVQDVIANVQTKRIAVSATRIADASAGDITVKSIQALLDSAMKEYHPNLPRLVVTAKAFGVLRKRIQSATVRNLVDFVNFSIREWNSIADRNRAAFLKNPSRAKGSPLSASPTFNEFAYRLPYFIAIYSSDLGGTATNSKSSSSDDQVSRLKAKLQEAERENQNNKEIIRRIRRPVPTQVVQRTQAVTRTPPKNKIALEDFSKALDTWQPPAWVGTNDNAKPRSRGVKHGK